MDYLQLGYIGLFLVCFLSATVLPLTSEGVLLVFLASGFHPITCLIVATIGNSIGGLTNYWLGMLGKPSHLKKLFRKPQRYDYMVKSISKYGYWLGLLSWTPFLGDPLTIALGYFRVKFWPMLILLVLGKFVRYYVIIYLWG